MDNSDQSRVRRVNIGGNFSGAEQGDESEKKLLCPVCSDEYGHVQNYERVDGHDSYKAWAGRGDAHRIFIAGECGHTWFLCVGEHKGNLVIYAEISTDSPPDDDDG
jgi:hypothetical protein